MKAPVHLQMKVVDDAIATEAVSGVATQRPRRHQILHCLNIPNEPAAAHLHVYLEAHREETGPKLRARDPTSQT